MPQFLGPVPLRVDSLLAEILGAIVRAGDLSRLASSCTHEFVAAHERLGRNRP